MKIDDPEIKQELPQIEPIIVGILAALILIVHVRELSPVTVMKAAKDFWNEWSKEYL